MIAKYHIIQVECLNHAAANGYQQVRKWDDAFWCHQQKVLKKLGMESGKLLKYMIKRVGLKTFP